MRAWKKSWLSHAAFLALASVGTADSYCVHAPIAREGDCACSLLAAVAWSAAILNGAQVARISICNRNGRRFACTRIRTVREGWAERDTRRPMVVDLS